MAEAAREIEAQGAERSRAGCAGGIRPLPKAATGAPFSFPSGCCDNGIRTRNLQILSLALYLVELYCGQDRPFFIERQRPTGFEFRPENPKLKAFRQAKGPGGSAGPSILESKCGQEAEKPSEAQGPGRLFTSDDVKTSRASCLAAERVVLYASSWPFG